MSFQSIEVHKWTLTIGAEIFGVDIGKGVSNSQFEDIHRALLENLVIFFRDQKITLDQQEFGRRFGKLHVHPQPSVPVEGHPDVIAVKADENSKRVSGGTIIRSVGLAIASRSVETSRIRTRAASIAEV